MIFRKYILPVLAVSGALLAADTVRQGSKPPIPAQPVAQPAASPFPAYVAGAGIVEALNENVAVGTPVAGVVAEVMAKPGDKVKKGDPLFRLDDRDLQAELVVRQANLKAAAGRLERLKSSPRPEDLPPAEAKLKEAQASLEDVRAQLRLYEAIGDSRAISQDELIRRRNAVAVGEARVAQAQAQLDLLKAGAWKSDIDVAQAEVNAAAAQVKAAEIMLDRLIIRSPMDGQVLQAKIRAGEYASPSGTRDPLMLIGSIDEVAVRVDVDENDAWRIRPGAKARAAVRGNGQFQTDLTYVRTEPYVVPKRSLTGESTERVDTRVLQVIYRFDRTKLPVYVGQQMDVFIDAPETR